MRLRPTDPESIDANVPASPVRLIRELTLSSSEPRHIAAASGATVVAGKLWVVADDELHLGCFDLSHKAPGTAVRVLAGELPADAAARKKVKPDLEALTFAPAGRGLDSAGLLAFPSGSTPNRERGVFLPLSASGEPAGPPRVLDLSRLYRRLGLTFAELNIEGATLRADELVLAQRGNGSRGENALIVLDWPMVAASIARAQPIPEAAVRHVRPITLTSLRDAKNAVPLTLTDLCALPDGRIVFTAAAEATGGSTYLDGLVIGSVVGVLDANGRVAGLSTVRGHKLEGVHAHLRPDGRIDVLLVTDADDPAHPAKLFGSQLTP